MSILKRLPFLLLLHARFLNSLWLFISGVIPLLPASPSRLQLVLGQPDDALCQHVAQGILLLVVILHHGLHHPLSGSWRHHWPRCGDLASVHSINKEVGKIN